MNARPLIAALGSLLMATSWTVWADEPFANASGSYSGLALPDTDNNPGDTTLVKMNLLPSGQVTGTVKNGWGTRLVLRASFDATGHLDHQIPAGKIILMDGSRVPFFYQVTAQLDANTRTMTGRIEPRTADTVYIGSAFTVSGLPPDPVLGDALAGNRETSFIEPPDPSTVGGLDIPGDGFTLVNVGKAKTRPARLVGKLPDGASYSAGTPLQGTRYAVLSSLYTVSRRIRTPNTVTTFYKYRGSTYGYGDVTPVSDPAPAMVMPPTVRSLSDRLTATVAGGVPALIAALRWHQEPSRDGSFIYSRGIRTDFNVDARYYPPVHREGLVPIGLDPYRRENAKITLRRGNMEAPVEAAITIRAGSVRFERMLAPDGNVGGNPYSIRMSMNALAGTFTGSFKHPVTGKRTTFSGAFRPKVGTTPGQGRGAFRGSLTQERLDAGSTLESGSVRITVVPAS